MGLQRGAIGKTLGGRREHIGNPIGNLNGTCWEQRKKEKKIPPPSPHHPKLKRKKMKAVLSAF